MKTRFCAAGASGIMFVAGLAVLLPAVHASPAITAQVCVCVINWVSRDLYVHTGVWKTFIYCDDVSARGQSVMGSNVWRLYSRVSCFENLAAHTSLSRQLLSSATSTNRPPRRIYKTPSGLSTHTLWCHCALQPWPPWLPYRLGWTLPKLYGVRHELRIDWYVKAWTNIKHRDRAASINSCSARSRARAIHPSYVHTHTYVPGYPIFYVRVIHIYY